MIYTADEFILLAYFLIGFGTAVYWFKDFLDMTSRDDHPVEYFMFLMFSLFMGTFWPVGLFMYTVGWLIKKITWRGL